MEGNRIPMRTVTSDDTDRVSQMESLLDNPLYRRLDYAEDCKALGITDLEMPHLPGMPTTAILKSWQVTGVKAMVDFEADPQLSACILADTTGLGKTIELLAFWVFVCNIQLRTRPFLLVHSPTCCHRNVYCHRLSFVVEYLSCR